MLSSMKGYMDLIVNDGVTWLIPSVIKDILHRYHKMVANIKWYLITVVYFHIPHLSRGS